MNQLIPFGWTNELQASWMHLSADGLQPARVIADFGTSLKIAMPEVKTAELTGKLAHHSHRENIPKIGDWVAVRCFDSGQVVVEAIIPRHNELARKAAGKQAMKQVIAANIDVAFVLLALDNDFSITRLERFLYQLSVTHITPIIVLNKVDKTADLSFYTNQLQVFDLPVVTTVATLGSGIDEILAQIHPGKTAILLGSSGVGKSTLTNKLLGRETQHTQAVRASDSTGKHTTVHRELFVLPNGGLLIDTPGIRELQLWGTTRELDEDFSDIARLARQCKYTSCRHGNEAGCAVQVALNSGELDLAHYERYLTMKRELSALKIKNDLRTARDNQKSRKNQDNEIKNRLKEMFE